MHHPSRSTTTVRLATAALLLGLAAAPAAAQYGRGLRPYRAQERGAYQFGFTKTYEIVLVNMSLQDVEFRLTKLKSEIHQKAEPNASWIVPAGGFGSTKVFALDVEGEFRTRRGVRIPVEPVLGQYYATFRFDEDALREFERRDPEGAVVIRDVTKGKYKPGREKPKYTRHSDRSQRLMRALSLLRSPRERPTNEREFPDVRPGEFPPLEEAELFNGLDDEDRKATTGRIRQPGEELVTVEMTRAAGEIPAGARFTATIGHALADRTVTGNVDGNGRVALFTTRDPNVRITFEIAGQGAADATTFTIDPSRDVYFPVRIR